MVRGSRCQASPQTRSFRQRAGQFSEGPCSTQTQAVQVANPAVCSLEFSAKLTVDNLSLARQVKSRRPIWE